MALYIFCEIVPVFLFFIPSFYRKIKCFLKIWNSIITWLHSTGTETYPIKVGWSILALHWIALSNLDCMGNCVIYLLHYLFPMLTINPPGLHRVFSLVTEWIKVQEQEHPRRDQWLSPVPALDTTFSGGWRSSWREHWNISPSRGRDERKQSWARVWKLHSAATLRCWRW